MSSPPDTQNPVSRLAPRLLWAALALATALVLALGWEVGRMRADQRWLVDRVTQPYVGMYVPKVALTSLDGQTRELGQPRADTQVLFFFTTTCPHCRASLPQLKRAAGQLRAGSSGTELIGVAFATPAQTAAYAREHGLDFPLVAHDDRRTSALFRARKVPSLLVIGRDGRVRYQHVGAINDKQTLRELMAAAQPRPAPPATMQRPLAAR
ncbi:MULTISPECIES: TlpA disulfide reductase family protein [unclassified Lysobacter]|uniref:peroxiredoxin family protein n=1 Tax=unclassified Lysobacter TaxID=2635362 RepID=UPI001BE65304|nr:MULTISPECIES: TlpA disulfide reductase family protein [unclassified Lysobacter]MBT2746905.1 TlpA family protein disulfide reductase [Lysobacter sp. ISL-42]MBT2750634.1 TlpA family protein disulfide reductase [Lysobacter sp. ISL-50]MBT2776480.1 TlpA family protein disulfide reductase [Lysobacter sp. ISL-54]MBT2780975.1 TlpA family protein disulfide reductase [Lysobacter sp. ISL-52]